MSSKESGEEVGVLQLALPAGLGPRANYLPSHILEFDPVSRKLSIPEGLTIKRWSEALRWMKTLDEHMDFVKADLMRFGYEKFGEEKVNAVAEQLELDLNEWSRAGAIALLGDLPRLPELSTEHLFVLAHSTFTEPERLQWSQTAAREKLTAAELAESIKAGKVVRSEAGTGGGRTGQAGFLSLQGLMFKAGRWWKQVTEKEPVEKWTKQRKQDFIAEVKPLVEAYEAVKSAL
jgi:hypothetical protein